ncbi:D-alanyl-D-alanine carboxypeptidase [Lichenihabitans sp. Uapishka_5]|uniref:D-alanyl-D-alanine carboxypeptidase family protein n=1 Tax=Lichenihabitans sp. Uapishka_5 TaxID=3037302 RepID=UPI0029E80C8B|nr:D-alanyl-D-alanine carboxypeptidase family protein [Lichenihabitans sp. Uapishka_5]MDX7953947.1 D-alanyl-D-alanine carboxypeptidase [Lichenihabitans sp. Uapishka_5]
MRGALAAAALMLMPAAEAATDDFQTTAAFAYLVDAGTGTVLFSKNGEAPMIPASTTKVMTAEVVFHEIKDGRLKLDDTFRVSEHAWRDGGTKSGGSTMFLAVNSTVRVEDLLRGLIIQSGNDAAITLAEGVAGSEDGFAKLMNERARAIGMAHSHFTNPWGRGDPDHRVTASDMARLAQWVIDTYPEFYKIFGERDFTWNKIRQPNRNPLLAMNIGADGLKTGDLAESGYGLVGSAVQNDERLIVVVNGLKTARDRANEAQKLLAWGFRTFEERTLFGPGEAVGTASVFGGERSEVALGTAKPITVLVPRGSGERLAGRIVYTGPLPAPVLKGTEVAHLVVTRGASPLVEVPLQTIEEVPVGSLGKRALDAGFELVGGFVRERLARH